MDVRSSSNIVSSCSQAIKFFLVIRNSQGRLAHGLSSTNLAEKRHDTFDSGSVECRPKRRLAGARWLFLPCCLTS